MTLDLDRVRSALDSLPLASDPAFRRLFSDRRLRYLGQDGEPDIVDELSARIACSVLLALPRRRTSTLIVFPDRTDRRSPLLLAAALVMDALASIEAARAGRVVLYVASHAGIRSQLASVKAGILSLDCVFAQQYGRGQADESRTLALPGGAHLPGVLSVSSPADPVRLLRQHRPKWVAVDCGEGRESAWLPALLAEASRTGLSVLGWSSNPLTGAVAQWLEAGGGMFRWPRLSPKAGRRILSFEGLGQTTLQAEVTPRTLFGERVLAISRTFVAAAEALLAAREWANGRLAVDAIALGWKYLRTLESLIVPLDVWEREAGSYWGMRRLSELRTTFGRFVEAVSGLSPNLHGVLQQVADALSQAEQQLELAESPLFLGLANLCVESTACRRIVFSSRPRREMFAFCLLAKFNISEDDLRDVGVDLVSLTELAHHASAKRRTNDGEDLVSKALPPLFVGVPSRFAERHLDFLLESGQLEVLVWPHQEHVLARRIEIIARSLQLASCGLGWLHPALEDIQGSRRGGDPYLPGLTVGRAQVAAAGAVGNELRRKADAVSLWKRPDAFEAIADLFDSTAPLEEEDSHAVPDLLEESGAPYQVPEASEELWVQEALEIRFQDGRRVVLPTDERINVVVHGRGGCEVEQRYVRTLRGGDEVLFIQGQRRQSLYDLLVSRVHRDPVIGQYLALVRRWQDDLVRAFDEAERQSSITVEGVLQELRARGSTLTSSQTVRSWLRRRVLSPNDAEDLKRIAEILSLRFVLDYYHQIHKAGRRLKGLHISLSARLNRWLASSAAGAVAAGDADALVDAELGLTIEDFRHSLLRLQVRDVTLQRGPFFRPQMGTLDGG